MNQNETETRASVEVGKLVLKFGKTILHPGGTQILVRVYPGKVDLLRIPSLKNPNTYYVVDPGNTDTSCNPSDKAGLLLSLHLLQRAFTVNL